jgi:hypothetical protein
VYSFGWVLDIHQHDFLHLLLHFRQLVIWPFVGLLFSPSVTCLIVHQCPAGFSISGLPLHVAPIAPSRARSYSFHMLTLAVPLHWRI